MSIDTRSQTIDKKLYAKLRSDLMRTFDSAVSRANSTGHYGSDTDPRGEYAQAVAQLAEIIVKLESMKPK